MEQQWCQMQFCYSLNKAPKGRRRSGIKCLFIIICLKALFSESDIISDIFTPIYICRLCWCLHQFTYHQFQHYQDQWPVCFLGWWMLNSIACIASETEKGTTCSQPWPSPYPRLMVWNEPLLAKEHLTAMQKKWG